MNHLILGDGNMGRRHAEILRYLGDTCDMEDIHFNFNKFDPKKYDSVLVCTWPESHQHYIMLFAIHKIPLFVEKPVQVTDFELNYPGISMVACNWRWCQHLKDADRIIVCYSGGKYVGLDLIHFADLFWHRFGKPETANIASFGNRYVLGMGYPGYLMCATLNYKSARIETWVNNKRIHKKPCDMFISQMRDWREIVQGKKQSPNTIETAAERTSWLINLFGRLDAEKTTDTRPICLAEV